MSPPPIEPELDLPALVAAVAARDPAAAPGLELLADRLRALAVELRADAPAGAEGIASPGGMSDRVRMRVVGADGEVKQTVDTGAQS